METGQIPQCRGIYHYLHWLTISKNLAGIFIEWSNCGLMLLFWWNQFLRGKEFFLTRYEPTLRNIYCTKITFNPTYQRKNPDLNLVQKNFKVILSKSFQITCTYLSKTWKKRCQQKTERLTGLDSHMSTTGRWWTSPIRESNVGILRFVLKV